MDKDLEYQNHDTNRLFQAGEFVAENLQVMCFIGSGGMSNVYKCFDLILSRVVAVKTLRAGFADDSLRRFQTEGRAIARLEHPNIVKLYGLLVGADYMPVLTMEFVDGISLASLLEKDGALSVSRSLRIALQIAEGLAAAQKQGIVHRDLKPANIMIVDAGAADEKVKILDSGIAKIQDELSVKATKTGDVFGTPQYMSPEQAMGKTCDGRSDQYSLGCVLFEMLCGHPPFQNDNVLSVLISHAQEQAPPLSKSMKHPPSARLQALVSKLLQKNPADRFESMEAVTQSIFRTTTQSGVASGRMIGVAVALMAIVAVVFVINSRGTENKEVSGHALSTTSPNTQTASAPAASFETNLSSLQDNVPVSVPGKLTEADYFVLNNQAHYLNGTVLNLKDKDEEQANERLDLTDVGLSTLVRNRNLTVVSINECQNITAAGIASLNGQPLTVLHIANTSVDDKAADILGKMSKLQELNLAKLSITKKTCQKIAGLTLLKNLELGETDIDASALRYVASIKNLDTLNLSATNVSGGLPALANSTIEELNLKNLRPQLTMADFEKGISRMSSLCRLYLDGSEITKSELQTLEQLKNLSRISLLDCKNLSAEDIIAFHKQLPLCLIDQDKGIDPQTIAPTVKPSQLLGPELVKNGGFEQGKAKATGQTYLSGPVFVPHWNVSDSVELVNKREQIPFSGNHSIELKGSQLGTIAQEISTTPGLRYCLNFKAAMADEQKHAPQLQPQIFQVRVDEEGFQFSVSEKKTDAQLHWRDYVWPFRAKEKKSILKIGCKGSGTCVYIDQVSVRLLVQR